MHLLHHAVGLGVESHCCNVIHLHLVAPRGPRAGSELCASVSGHVCRQAETRYPAADKNVQHCLSCDLLQGRGLELPHASVYHSEEVVVPCMCCWANQVHSCSGMLIFFTGVLG